MTEPGKRQKSGKRLKWHYLDSHRKTHGGFTTEQFVELIHSGQLNSRNYIWNGKTITAWARIEKSLDELEKIGVDRNKIAIKQKSGRNRSSTIGANHPPPEKEETYQAPPQRSAERETYQQPLQRGDERETYEAPLQRSVEREPYQAPVQSYQAPVQTYQAPVQSYQAPTQTYQAPAVQRVPEPAPIQQQMTQHPEPKQEPIRLEPMRHQPTTFAPKLTPQPAVHVTPTTQNEVPKAVVNNKPVKMEYEGVALVISSCVTYGTVMGEITFDRASKKCKFDMHFHPVHQDAPQAHQTQLQFVWNPKTCQLIHAIESGSPMWEGTCVDIGNAFHIKNQEGIDICMIPSSIEKLDPRITEFRSTYIGLALGVDQATFWGTYFGDITFNIPSKTVHFEMAFESSFPDQLENHRQELDFQWDPEKGEVDDERNQFFGRCVGVGNCFHVRNSFGMDIIFMRQIPGDPEPDEVYENKVNYVQADETPVKQSEPEPEQIRSEVRASPVESMKQAEKEVAAPRGSPDNDHSYADRSESEGTAILRSQIDQKNESETILRSQLEDLAAKLNDQVLKQQEKDRQREDQIQQLNLQWTQKAENLRMQALQEAETRFQSDREQSQSLIQNMQGRLAELEKTIQREQIDRQQIEQRLDDRRKETQSLHKKMLELEREKQKIQAEKDSMREQLQRQNLEIEQLREELSRSRQNTPAREFAPAQPKGPNGFSLMGRPVRSSKPVLTETGPVRGAAGGLGFGRPKQQMTQPQQQQMAGRSLGGGLRSHQQVSESAEPYAAPRQMNQVPVSKTPEINRQPEPARKVSLSEDRDAFIRNMAMTIKRKRSEPRIVE